LLEKLDRVRARLDAKRLRAEATMAERVYLFYELARRVARGSEAVKQRLEPVKAAFRQAAEPARGRYTACGSRYTSSTATSIPDAASLTLLPAPATPRDQRSRSDATLTDHAGGGHT